MRYTVTTVTYSRATALQVEKKAASWGYNYSSAIWQVYQPNGYTVCTPSDSTTTCWLQLAKHVDCPALLRDYAATLQAHVPVFPTPRQLPTLLQDEFLLGNFTQLSEMYIPQPDYDPTAAVPVWTQETIREFTQQANAGKPMGSYGEAALAIYKALHCHPIKAQTGAVFGSASPWVEALLFAAGVFSVCNTVTKTDELARGVVTVWFMADAHP